MKRTFPQQTVAATNTIQPLVSTTLAATYAASPSGGNQSMQVASSSGFNVSDCVALSAGTTRLEFARVISVPDSTHLNVQGLAGINLSGGTANAHNSGDFVVPFYRVKAVYVQRVANDTSVLYVGTSNLNPGAATPIGILGSIIGVAAATQPNDLNDGSIFELANLYDYWVYGTQNTVYNVTTTSQNPS